MKRTVRVAVPAHGVIYTKEFDAPHLSGMDTLAAVSIETDEGTRMYRLNVGRGGGLYVGRVYPAKKKGTGE